MKFKLVVFATMCVAFLLPISAYAATTDEEVTAVEASIAKVTAEIRTVNEQKKAIEEQLETLQQRRQEAQQNSRKLRQSLANQQAVLEEYLDEKDIERAMADNLEASNFNVSFFKAEPFATELDVLNEQKKALQLEVNSLSLLNSQQQLAEEQKIVLQATATKLEKQADVEAKQLQELLALQAATEFVSPLQTALQVSSWFGYREDPIGTLGNMHEGIDFTGMMGEVVMAARAGVVAEAAFGPAQGNCVIIQHDNGYYSYYMHLTDISVSVGQTVSAGEQIGTMGTTGYSTGVHLHFGLSTGLWNGYVDPAPFLNLN